MLCYLFIYKGGVIISNILERKDADWNYHPFIESSGDYDIYFLGSSHAADAFSPLILWKNYGYSSYNLASASDRIPCSYWKLLYSIERHKPELVIIDCAYLYYNEKYGTEAMLHNFWDAMPCNSIKIKAILDLVENQDERLALLSNFALYHNGWDNITRENFERINEYTWRYGASLIIGRSNEPVNYKVNFSPVCSPVESIGKDYLVKIIETCQINDINILLTYLPFEGNEQSKNDERYIHELADKYDVEYIDFGQLDIVDENISFFDNMEDNSHLNAIGAYQITDYIGSYIEITFPQISPMSHEDDRYYKWKESYKAFMDYNSTCMNKAEIAKELSIFLQYLNCKNENLYMIANLEQIRESSKGEIICEELGMEKDKFVNHECIILFNLGSASKIINIPLDEPVAFEEYGHDFLISKSTDVLLFSVDGDEMELSLGKIGLAVVDMDSENIMFAGTFSMVDGEYIRD